MRLVRVFLFIAALFLCASAFAEEPGQACVNLASVYIPNVTITSIQYLKPGWTSAEQKGFINSKPVPIAKPACRIIAYSAPSIDSHIGIEVWLPTPDSWNGKFLAIGNPGFIGSIATTGLIGNSEKGWATAATDTGHVDDTAKWAPGHPEKWADWGYRAVHEMTVTAKTLIENYYGKRPQHSYWNSCHNGGNQGLNEAQRYPEDYDGLVIGDPAFYISHLQPGSLYISWLALKDGVEAPNYIPTKKLAVINRAALDACDDIDGLKDDLITDPRKCKFDPKVLQCPGNKDGDSCLTTAQIDTVKKIYAGAKFKDGTQIYTGFEPGSELGWAPIMIEKDPFFVNVDYFKGMVHEDLNWDWRKFDVEKDTRKGIAKAGPMVDGNNPDLRGLKKAGGKVIIVGSWNSVALPPRRLSQYYDDVAKEMGGLSKTSDFARLFMAPGAGGCIGFMTGGRDFDSFTAIQNWVEKGVAPESIVYTQTPQGGVARSRPVCAYPKVAKYKGSGDSNNAANFECANPIK